jgi:hypothetical protein
MCIEVDLIPLFESKFNTFDGQSLTRSQLIVVGFGAVILTELYLLRHDLASNMLAHFLTDFIGFLLARLQGA